MSGAPAVLSLPPPRIGDPFGAVAARLAAADPRPRRGRLDRAVGVLLHAAGLPAGIGELCRLADPASGRSLFAEVIGLDEDGLLLTPIGATAGLSPRTQVVPLGRGLEVTVGDGLLGRVLDGLGRPADGRGPLVGQRVPVDGVAPDALARPPIARPLPLGIRALDGLLTCGEGQRIGLYGPPGVGKSSLLSLLVGGAEVDAVVIGLIGERGREVREFLDRSLGEERRRRAVVVVSTADRPAVERVKAAFVATAVAERFRDQGRRVLLLMDSLTRFARALREIGLAAGEPPARRGFPPSVFAALPRLVERAGPAPAGSITAVYTVLSEGDPMTDPIAEETRGLLDGHVVLSPALAAAGHFPAIDVLDSRSRVMDAVVAPPHDAAARHLRALLARHAEVELLVQVGEYRPGSDPLADEAIARQAAIRGFLRQDGAAVPFADTVAALIRLAGG